MAVEIGHVNLTIAVWLLGFESDFAFADAFFAGDGFHDVIGKSMGFAAYACARIAARKQFFSTEGDTTDDASIITAADVVLGLGRRNEAEALDIEIKFQNIQAFTAETFN